MKLKASHWMNISLGAIALVLFAANMRQQLAGQTLNLRAGTGATFLTLFLVGGVVSQLVKLLQGHDTNWELAFTMLLLTAHVVGDIWIWYTTQIQGLPLPAEVPFLITGGYWLVAVADLTVLALTRQFAAESADAAALSEVRAALSEMEAALSDRSATAKEPLYDRDCPHCGRTFRSATEQGATNAVNAHLRTCAKKSEVHQNSNGHRHEPVSAGRENPVDHLS